MAKHTPLVSQFLEKISRSALEKKYQKVIRKYVAKRHGVYALYRGNQLYYVGLASDLSTRLQAHLEDRHSKSWDRFSVYLTIDDSHIKELESLVLRIARPPGTRQVGTFSKAENLKIQLRQDIKKKLNKEVDNIVGGQKIKPSVKPTPTSSKNRTGRTPALSKYVRDIPIPRKLRAKFKNKPITAMVAKDGTIHYAGKLYSSPSGAGKAVCGNECSGWDFWSYKRASGDWVFIDQLRK